MDFKQMMTKRVNDVEDILKSYLPTDEKLTFTITDAMKYSTLSNGKRIRAIMMLETYKMFNGVGEVINPFVAAIEMIHAYSLVHDDLPALDNDEYRRGALSTHAKYGEAMGILCGDALLNYAFETVAKAFDIECNERDGGIHTQVFGDAAADARDLLIPGALVDASVRRSLIVADDVLINEIPDGQPGRNGHNALHNRFPLSWTAPAVCFLLFR